MNKSDVQTAGLDAEAAQTRSVEKILGTYPFNVIGVNSGGLIVFVLQHHNARNSGGRNQQAIKKLRAAGYTWTKYKLRDGSEKRGWA